MLFNSYTFIFLFFPVVLIGYFLLGKTGKTRWTSLWLVAASLAFYGYWNVKYLPLLVGSILVNYFFSGLILAAREKGQGMGKPFFWSGLLFNLLLLGYYKYTDFLLGSLNALGAQFELLHVFLPFGISFFTITQLLYLVDCYAGVAKDHDFLRYALFVSFFPHLLSGPILYHKPMMTQFQNASLLTVNWDNMSRGMTLFIIGLMKKVLIADTFSAFVAGGFGHTGDIELAAAWLTILAYMLQLYFDFSGYSDMAVGMSRMMNISIPINFNAPYRAKSLVDFWQRWHISLTNAITACIYMPLMKSFRKPDFLHTALAIFVTFFLVGIWHGAGWTFVVFALMHAGGLVVNHVWKHYHLWMPEVLGRCMTILYVIASMAFFRASDVGNALELLQGMAGFHGGFSWPVQTAAESVTVQTFGLPLVPFLIALALVIRCPSSNEIAKKMEFSSSAVFLLALGFAVTLFSLSRPTEFLYLQF